MKQQEYKHFPFITPQSLLTGVGSYLILMLVPVYFYFSITPGNTALAPTVALLVTLLFIEYFLLFIVPYVLYIRLTGRFLHLPLQYRVRGVQPFSPFLSRPLEYGARPYGGFVSFVASTLLLFAFMLFVFMPTIYYLFGRT